MHWTIAGTDPTGTWPNFPVLPEPAQGALKRPEFTNVARSHRAPASLYLRRDVDADRHPWGVHHPTDADGYFSRHRYPRRVRDLELRRSASAGDGAAHHHRLRACADDHGERHR